MLHFVGHLQELAAAAAMVEHWLWVCVPWVAGCTVRQEPRPADTLRLISGTSPRVLLAPSV